jgi:1,4-alpha-glucan branching enzyme
MADRQRTFPIGAEIFPNGVSFRVFAPLCQKVSVCLEDSNKKTFFQLKPEGNGFFSEILKEFKEGSLYRLRSSMQKNHLPIEVVLHKPGVSLNF